MTPNRERTGRGRIHRTKTQPEKHAQLERRRAAMHAAEGHAGSIPRGNQQPEREILGSHHIEWDRVLGH